MAGTRGRTDPPVGALLDEEPWRFDFAQALRLLEARARRRHAAAGGASNEAGAVDPPVRLRAADTLAYPATEVVALEHDGAGRGAGPPAALVTSLFGLTGPLGVLPQHYTELLHAARREQNPAFRDFLDIFNHRLLTLFAQAAAKYRLDLSFERSAAGAPDPVTAALQALVGIHGAGLPPTLPPALPAPLPPNLPAAVGQAPALDAATLVHYAGHLSQRRPSAAALQAILSDDLGVPVRIEPFRTAWLAVPPDEQSRLGTAFCTFDDDLLLGERSQSVQGSFRIVLGPLDYAAFRDFLPGGPGMARLAALARFQVGPDLDFDVQLVLRRAEVPECELAAGGAAEPRLGWNAWLGPQGAPGDAADAVFGSAL
ncbi:type VI secretion system baseplate subunit TssG [Arenibaculum pallidiluteum]|uniref:type VI secretion system baseplate subunit TssG n=1 Tax=Arenibaculum pallidiluteum TaxID=2812559 RepID=UPI001A957CBD|nr:type VI secretion system baseplate subunit TssG [Arenibaculum pallidiluteum]